MVKHSRASFTLRWVHISHAGAEVVKTDGRTCRLLAGPALVVHDYATSSSLL